MEKRKRLGDLLIESRLITQEQLKETLQLKKREQKIGDALVERGYINEQQLIEVLEFQLGIPHVTLYSYPVDESLTSLVSKDFALRHVILPLKKEGNVLTIAMSDPMDFYTIDDIRLSTGLTISPVIAKKDEIIQSIYKYYDMKETFSEQDTVISPANTGDNAPAVRLVDQILTSGLQLRASDIHIDPHEEKILIRYRVDGMLRTERVISKNIYESLIARIKIMANMNITESRLPQDGRIKLKMYATPIDLRISILPTLHGEKVVMRILDLSKVLKKLAQLDFNRTNLQRFVQLIERPQGLVLITGPTGAGKTSTLYAGLHHLNKAEVNIVTIEDPVEYELEGINQVQVNPQIGLTFANGLRSILRQDPNIIMIGEIRDQETADIAVRSALTGHLVLSTLHTNSAIAAIPRLIDMGVEPYLVASSLSGVVAQRLVRKLCRDCREEYEPSEMEIDLFQKRGISIDHLYRAKGCPLCRQTGYSGRMAIQEVLIVDESLKSLMLNNSSMQHLKNHASQHGMISLAADGLLKVKMGYTSLEEVLSAVVES
ncbi:type IV pilus assembly protein PilB [Bacillus oleivorans]|uniref:Type IV pilus assembly protein PilB n=1 Tax=Bacillus oleivorans TaxID=1448271 RepID=A0A285CVF0_9BACI|nr:type IV pilus assembly protein PilB [Bacillus oleivorans]